MSLVQRLVRRVRGQARRGVLALSSRHDADYLDPDVPMMGRASHGKFRDFVMAEGDRPGARILELGSREVTGPSHYRGRMAHAQYVGFDYYPGPNVDVVGDAHRLASHFDAQPRFDLVFSTACFEHFAMPWVVAAEVAQVVKVGGLVVVETHFAFSAHERPWHFFHYTDMGLRALFPPAMGFECVEAGMSNPLVARFSMLADPYLRGGKLKGLYCHVGFVGRKVRDVPDFDWRTVDLEAVVGPTRYPAPAGSPKA